MSLRGYAYYLLPGLNSRHHPALDRRRLLRPGALAQPMEETGESQAQVTFLMTTSDQAYAKAAGYDMETTQRERRPVGPFYVGWPANWTRRGWCGLPLRACWTTA